MHLELAVPALFPAHGAPSLPALELLLARGRRTPGKGGNLEAWLAGAFDLEENAGDAGDTLPAGALTALAGGQAPGPQAWLRADPVHLRADRDRLVLVPPEAFAVTAAEASALAGVLAPLLTGKFTLFPVQPERWCLRVEGEGEAAASDRAPVELAGQNIDPHLPPKQWHPLLTEIQMALYEHPVNTAREARGDPVINSLWLWGAGRLPASTSGPWQSVSAENPVAAGLGRLAGMRQRAPGAGADEWLGRAPEDGRHLLVLDGLRGAQALGDLDGYARRLQALEALWFAPLLAALKAGRIGMLTLHAPEAGASFEAARADLRHFWRRPRPLDSYRITPA